VYFVSAPADLKRKFVSQFVYEQLKKLHPAFSEASVFDWQYLVFNNSQWIMVTVMDRETIEEYRILHRGAAFFTNTAIAVHKKDFTNNGINTIDDERIGFDVENNKPVSLPLESEKRNETPSQEAALKAIPPWYGLFTESEQHRGITTLSVSILAMMLLSLVFVLAAKGTKEPVHFDPPVEPIAEISYLPSAIEILEKFSRDIVETGGTMAHWKYNEDADSIMEIQTQGMDLTKIYEICNRYEFLSLREIQEVKYQGGEPVVTIQLNQAGKGYSLLNANAFSSQDSTIHLIDGISNLLRQQKVSISTEILPTDHNGKDSYSIAYTAKDRSLISSLGIIAASCNEYLLSIKRLEISIASGNNLFSVNVALSQSGETNRALYSLGNEKDKIPAAFGYKEEPPGIVLTEKKVLEAKPKNSLVGSIKDSSGQMVFYHDAITKKIVVGGNYD
jgi:hypothetical protein